MAQFLRLLHDNHVKKVFVHCQTGDDRTGMMIAAYRMTEQGWTAEEAMKEMEAYGFTSSHHLICPGLASYEARFPTRFKTSPGFRDLRRSEHISRTIAFGLTLRFRERRLTPRLRPPAILRDCRQAEKTIPSAMAAAANAAVAPGVVWLGSENPRARLPVSRTESEAAIYTNRSSGNDCSKGDWVTKPRPARAG